MKKLLIVGAFLLLTIPAFCETQTYTILRRLSSMTFEVSAQLHEVHGESRSFSGTITGDPADITTAKIQLKLDPASLNTDNEKRDKELRDHCLEVVTFPAIEFESTSIDAPQKQLREGQAVDATVHGKLKMHGLEKDIAVPVKITLKGEELSAGGSMAVVLDEWKIFRPKVMVVQVQNDVKINFTVGGRRNPAP